MSETKPEKRICIVGTAPTHKLVPYDDPTLEVWHLNDAHVLNPPRADRWFDLHPFNKMFFRPDDRPIHAHDVPAGFFVRPHDHLGWLKRQTIPVYVQDAALLGSPSAVTFPKAAIEQRFGQDFASTPAWMLALAILEGATEIHIYGIHLATEWEYIRQKPNLTFLMGIAAGLGIRLVLPKGCPLLKHAHQYAYGEDPDVPKIVLQRKLQRLQVEKANVLQHAKTLHWYQRDPNFRSRMALLDAQIADCQLGIQHVIAGRPPVGV